MSTLGGFHFNAVLPIRTEKQKVYPYVAELNARTERCSNTALLTVVSLSSCRSNEFCIHKPSALLLNGLNCSSAIRELLMVDLKRQHFCVTFCFKLGRTVHRRIRNLALQLRPRNKTAVISVEKPSLSTPDEGKSGVKT